MAFEANIDRGVISGYVASAAYMDAGVSGGIAGLEIGLERARVSSEPGQPNFRPDLTLTLAFDPITGQALAYLLADKMGLPTFNEREWRIIAARLRSNANVSAPECEELAERIERALA